MEENAVFRKKMEMAVTKLGKVTICENQLIL